MKSPRSMLEPRVDLLAHRRVPAPPPELAAKVLAAARLAGTARARRDWTDRLWESSVARLLWGTVTCALLAANLAATRPGTIASPRGVQHPSPVAGALTIPSTGAEDLFDFPSSLLPGFLHRQRGSGGEQRRQLAALLSAARDRGDASREGHLRANDTRPRAGAGRC